MLLIMSDETDVSTHRVINWLLHLKIPYYRINDTCSIHVDYLTTHNGQLDFKLSITTPYPPLIAPSQKLLYRMVLKDLYRKAQVIIPDHSL